MTETQPEPEEAGLTAALVRAKTVGPFDARTKPRRDVAVFRAGRQYLGFVVIKRKGTPYLIQRNRMKLREEES